MLAGRVSVCRFSFCARHSLVLAGEWCWFRQDPDVGEAVGSGQRVGWIFSFEPLQGGFVLQSVDAGVPVESYDLLVQLNGSGSVFDCIAHFDVILKTLIVEEGVTPEAGAAGEAAVESVVHSFGNFMAE